VIRGRKTDHNEKSIGRSDEAEQNSQGLQHLKNVTLLFQVRRLQPVLNLSILKDPCYFLGFYYPFGVFLSSLNFKKILSVAKTDQNILA